MKLKELALISLLGACGGLGILTTHIFHALIPLPGFGALLSLPLSAACMIIARGRAEHPAAAGMSKLIQHVVILLLPGGPATAHNPFLLPILALDGFVIDLVYWLKPVRLAESKLYAGLVSGLAGATGMLLQAGLLYLIIGDAQFYLNSGIGYFVGIFVLFHALLRGLGGIAGSAVLRAIPERTI